MYKLCNIFKNSCEDRKKLCINENIPESVNWYKVLDFEPSAQLEQKLQDLVNLMVGFSFTGTYDGSGIKVCFDNVVRNIPNSSYHNIYDIIADYIAHYNKLFEDNHLVDLFVRVIKKIYSPNYNGKPGIEYDRTPVDKDEDVTYIGVYGKTITIGQLTRLNKEAVPLIQIHDAYACEQVLKDFIQTIKDGKTAYNLYALPGMASVYDEDDLASMIFEGVILNASEYELSHVDDYFRKYTFIIDDKIMPSLTQTTKIGDAFDDEVYFKVKGSNIEFETPWFFAFMLKNHEFMLPSVRLGLTTVEGKTSANIVAIQSSSVTNHNPEVSRIIKDNIPKNSTFRHYNPEHFISLVLAFGVLNGLGITNINVQDFMPIRYRKTVMDKHFNEEEANNYIQRVYDQNIACYFKMALLSDDVMIQNFPGSGDNIIIETNDTIEFNNEFLDHLYLLGYNYGKSKRITTLER